MTSSSRKEKLTNQKLTQKSAAKKLANQSSDGKLNDPSHHRSIVKLDTRDRLAEAETRLKGMHIEQYMERMMAKVPGGSSESEDATGSNLKERNDDEQLEISPKNKPSREVMKTVETLDETYSVRKRLRSADKQSMEVNERKDISSKCVRENFPVIGQHAKVQAFLQSKPTTFATEGTPAEISRCTSLSDLTIESESKSFEFGALKHRLDDQPQEVVAGGKAHEFPSVLNTCELNNEQEEAGPNLPQRQRDHTEKDKSELESQKIVEHKDKVL